MEVTFNFASWVSSFFPKHDAYLEPFFGNCGALLYKERSTVEVISDPDGEVVNLFDWIRKDPERLARAIQYVPYARQSHTAAMRSHSLTPFHKGSLERAVNLCVRLGQGSGGGGGWNGNAKAAHDWVALPEKILLVADRLQGVLVEGPSFHRLMEEYNDPDSLVFFNPPCRACRSRKARRDFDDSVEVLVAARLHKGPVLVCLHDSRFNDPRCADLYADLLCGWHQESLDYGLAGKVTLYMNYDPTMQEFKKNIGGTR